MQRNLIIIVAGLLLSGNFLQAMENHKKEISDDLLTRYDFLASYVVNLHASTLLATVDEVWAQSLLGKQRPEFPEIQEAKKDFRDACFNALKREILIDYRKNFTETEIEELSGIMNSPLWVKHTELIQKTGYSCAAPECRWRIENKLEKTAIQLNNKIEENSKGLLEQVYARFSNDAK